MARKQVLVQLDDSLVERLDRVADRLDVSRSELLRRGAEALLAAEDDAAADRALIEAYRRTPVEPGLIAAAEVLAAAGAPRW